MKKRLTIADTYVVCGYDADRIQSGLDNKIDEE